MRNIKLTLEYDGIDFHGWQIQPKFRTVQGVLEETIGQLLQEVISVIGAGRTDAGVHALNYICNFKTENPLPLEKIEKGLNALLPEDIVVHCVEDVSLDFHARFDARQRRYRYLITYDRTALRRKYIWQYQYPPLDLDRMIAATKPVWGNHDFQAFCAANSGVENYFVNVIDLSWQQHQNNLVFEITANRFLRGMVRSLVGTMVEIGRGKMKIDQMKKAIESGDRTLIGPTAPPQGLYLVDILYSE